MENIYYKDYLVSRVISQGKTVPHYSPVYYETNENLIELLNYDFKDKTVFSVLASSDQVLTSRLLEAKNVDAFDYNRLTLYYYYLRIWVLKYTNNLYPPVFEGDNKWLRDLLSKVKPTSKQESQVLLFFLRHLQADTDLSKLFYYIEYQPEGHILYDKRDDLVDCLDQPLDFRHIDMFEPFDIEKQYDILLLSNILEWARADKDKLIIARDNINRLLAPGGIAVCSKILYKTLPKSLEAEKEVFKSLEYTPGKDTYSYKKI